MMNPCNKLVTFFITPVSSFRHVSMPFVQRNTGASFQRCMQNYIREKVSQNLEVYIDDIVIQSQKAR
jgi:hypothetical protein